MTENEKLLARLKALAGPELYEAILSEFAGDRIYFPVVVVDRDRRNREIRKAFYQGARIEALAYQYDMSYSHIRRIINERS